jgi:hypothetical protein
MSLPLGYSIKIAIVTKITKTFVRCAFVSHSGEREFDCPIPHPYASLGGGILVGISEGTLVAVAKATNERNFIVAIIPDREYYFDQSGVKDTPYNITNFPELTPGQIILKSPTTGSYINISNDGNISFDAGMGTSQADIELSNGTKTLFFRANNEYKFTEAGRKIEGIIKRDRNAEESVETANAFDFLNGEPYDTFLSAVGRSPEYETSNSTTSVIRDFTRNPPLVEKREIVYEYANSAAVRNISIESLAMLSKNNESESDALLENTGDRKNRRTDTLNLDMYNYNHLIEKTEGTVVDIYGNVLDINRNIINVPSTETASSTTDATKELQNIYRYLRRSIKMHYEINSRKEIEGDEPSRDNIENLGRDHSRWSIDVDGEGLTKINIPASSNTGNIPVLGRYLTTVSEENRTSGSFRNEENGKFVDVKLYGFGSDSVSISDSEYRPITIDGGTINYAGTAYHDLTSIASSIYSDGKFDSGSPMTSSINNKIGDSFGDNANAGGKSAHVNLDGSLEMSIGADNVDTKSVVLDLEGGIVSCIGKDKNDKSIICQTDGDVIVQVGTSGLTGHSGRVEIHLAGGLGGKASKIIIDEQGMTIDVQGNAVFSASGDLTVTAGARLLLNGELVFTYGSCDTDVKGTRSIKGSEKLHVRNGMPDQI